MQLILKNLFGNAEVVAEYMIHNVLQWSGLIPPGNIEYSGVAFAKRVFIEPSLHATTTIANNY